MNAIKEELIEYSKGAGVLDIPSLYMIVYPWLTIEHNTKDSTYSITADYKNTAVKCIFKI